MEEYNVICFNNDICIVALNTVYDIGIIMKKYIKKENIKNQFTGILIFDALLSSTSYNDKDRFYYFKSNQGVVDFSNKISNYIISTEMKKICNDYFDKHNQLLKNSFLLDFNS